MKKLKTIYFATPDFAVPTLDLLHNHPSIELTHVISMPDRPAGRGHQLKSPEVIEFAKENKISFFQTENINKEEEFLKVLENEKPDLIIVLAFAQFLGSRLLNLPSKGSFNIHTSLLPKYRGAAPIQYALLNGDKTTGVSIQKMVKKMDAGDIAHSHQIDISNDETGGQLYTRLKLQAALACNDLVNKIKEDNIIFTPQDESNVSFAPTLKKEDGFLNFKESSFDILNNQVRAMDPWPGTYFFINSKRTKVFNIEKSSEKLIPGEVKTVYQQLLIGCSDSTVRVCELQLAGKKRCTDTQFLNGFREDINLDTP
ncbi:MAG: methionyl-tRNA formyltransferase [Thermoproteota archaeon]|jgi:methionyl-tRNA formyltransferase